MLQNTVLAVLFAVGVAIGWGASSIRETDAPPGATSKRSQQTSSETRTEVDAIAVASAELDQTAARLSSYESYEDETDEFDGTITGRVFDASGAGLQGVEVIAGVAGHRRGRKSAIDLSLEDYVRQALDDHHFRQAHERRARSDTDGNFTLEGVGPDEYWVHAELEGFLFTVAEGSKVRRIEAGGNVELVGSVAGTIDIEVVLPAGVWSDSLWVSVKQEDASRSTRRWASEVITIPALVGEATIAATSLELVAEPISVSVVAGEVAQAQLRMEPKLGVRGQIFYESGQPLDQGIVRFMRSSATLTPEGLAKSNEAETDWYSLGDEYRFSVDEPGTYVVGVGFDQRRVDHMETIEVTDGVVRLDIYLPDPSPSEVIVVSVVGPK